MRDGHLRNVAFGDLTRLVEAVGFVEARRRGSHRVYVHPGVEEILPLQEAGGEAKPYQIRQFLALVERYDLGIKERP